MDNNALRDRIWNYLFRAKAAKSIDEIVAHVAEDASSVRAAIDHEWFTLNQDQVSIAYSVPK